MECICCGENGEQLILLHGKVDHLALNRLWKRVNCWQCAETHTHSRQPETVGALSYSGSRSDDAYEEIAKNDKVGLKIILEKIRTIETRIKFDEINSKMYQSSRRKDEVDVYAITHRSRSLQSGRWQHDNTGAHIQHRAVATISGGGIRTMLKQMYIGAWIGNVTEYYSTQLTCHTPLTRACRVWALRRCRQEAPRESH